MDNLRAVIKNVFCYISPEDILLQHTQYDNVSKDTFVKLGSGYISNYSNDELQNMYYFLENEFNWSRCRLRDITPDLEEDKDWRFNVFAALTIFNNAVLIEEDGEPRCQYVQLLRWRDMTTSLEEDLFITSFLAYKDGLSARQRKNFFWCPVIGHNNRVLNALLENGVAENHFHLKGSAPHFHLSWISLMNNADSRTFQGILDDYDANRLQKNISYDVRYAGRSLGHRWRQAALIRVFLFSVIKDTYLRLPAYQMNAVELLELCSEDEREQVRAIIDKGFAQQVCVDDILQQLGGKVDGKVLDLLIIRVRQKCSENYIRRLLLNENELKDVSDLIQDNIEYLKENFGKNDLDYAICETFLTENKQGHTNEALSGERWFLYTMFQAVYRQEGMEERQIKNVRLHSYFNLFYLYIVIKADMRRELIQANKNVGFANFMLYQNRKEDFIENTPYEKVYLKMAVRDTIYNQHIKSLEARIAPKDNVNDMAKSIRKYDGWITDGMGETEQRKLKRKYFYVMHFVKESEIWIRQNISEFKIPTRQNQYEYKCRIRQENNIDECRHYAKREEVKRQALAIAQLRECGAAEAARIRGIDAASPEIWCRPEVFAQAFRYLKHHTVSDETKKYADVQCSRLMATYHVGEDFLDIVDGLRAIEEAILFLNLHCGDRLGHALALGIDVDSWYEGKSNRILINKLGYLDNMVWLYARIRKYNIPDCVAAMSYIEKRFEEYFQEVYGRYIQPEKIKDNNMSFNINIYYDAWKLRGDNPEYYRKGFFELRGDILDDWEEYAVNKEYPHDYKVRYNPSVAYLNYMYHYHAGVKYTGDQMTEIKVSPVIRDAVKKVAARMQRDISDFGIGIETNPSSNYLIGTFRRYDRHPIVNWYNLGLTNNAEELEKCPQMQVSINTDDQGVFATYIENEYAYLALALEKCVDKDGKRIYNRTMIMKWLDNIRRMGIDQSFANV